MPCNDGIEEVREQIEEAAGMQSQSFSSAEQGGNTMFLFFFTVLFFILIQCNLLALFFLGKWCLPCDVYTVPSHVDDEFEKWQREVREAEIEAERLKNGSASDSVGGYMGRDDHDGVPASPEGEDEFTDDDGTRYKWDRGLRAWVPQVCAVGLC